MTSHFVLAPTGGELILSNRKSIREVNSEWEYN